MLLAGAPVTAPQLAVAVELRAQQELQAQREPQVMLAQRIKVAKVGQVALLIPQAQAVLVVLVAYLEAVVEAVGPVLRLAAMAALAAVVK